MYNKYMANMRNPKTVFVHEYLVQYGGAERTLEAMMELYPDAPIYTGLYEPKGLSDEINARHIIYPKNSLMARFPKYLTFLMPLVFERFDLREYDLIISDGTAWPKGVLTKHDQLHISYIHTPPRFLYGYSVESQKRDKWYFKPFVKVIDFFLRIWDFSAAQRPDHILTNSRETQARIKKFYGRDATVIYPPVDLEFPVTGIPDTGFEKYYLMVGRMSAYKNFDLVINAFNQLGFPLVIAGTGLEEEKLRSLAKENIRFMGRVSEEVKHGLLKNCLGLINPVKDEDFGIVPVEAMAHGKPVLAHRSGGHLETVIPDVTGMFFEESTLESFIEGFKAFDQKVMNGHFDENLIKDKAQRFSRARFQKEFKEFIDSKLSTPETKTV